MSLVRIRKSFAAMVCCAAALCVASSARGQQPEQVSACQLKDNPAAYNHHLIQVTAFAARGFEDFTLFDPSCSAWPNVWLEYGGTVASGTVYCCGVTDARSRPSELSVENVAIPLADNPEFREFDELIQRQPDAVAHATIIGRFFSGRVGSDSKVAYGGAYGHMGCCSLLAIEQIVAVDAQTRTDLDYRAFPDQPKIENKVGCGVRDMLYQHAQGELIEAQRRAESGQAPHAFDDPERVGMDALAALLQIDAGSIAHFKRTHEAQARVTYEWNSRGDPPDSYMVIVSRPYWLSFYAKDPNKVAWVVTGAFESSCGLADKKHGHFPL